MYENQNQYNFKATDDGIVTITEQNTKITHTRIVERSVFGYIIRYERVLLLKTVRARLHYSMYNNPLARFKRNLVPFIRKKLYIYGIDITRA